jgi:hypothetical protein
MIAVDWFVQLVDSSAFVEPNEVREAVRDWLRDAPVSIGAHINWTDDAVYPNTISFCGTFPAANMAALLASIQDVIGRTEYMVFAEVCDATKYESPFMLHVVTKTLIATMGGHEMVRELVRQLHTAAAPATGANSAE